MTIDFPLVFSLFPAVYYAMDKKTSKSRTRKSPYTFKGRIWIDGKEGTFLGYGRIVLLERIKKYGSITRAAKSMEMSYRHAWELVDSMNRQAPKPFVETAAGGKGGGGTILTEEGEKAVSLFWKFYGDFQDFLKHEEKNLSELFHKPKNGN
ncbi:MAG TPA: ModE family transcriptional regulator [Thermodesulfovibrionales bacterium]|nr:ModE family transcriptional regulator [Thermodesulfovibrionales bacterium]